MLRTMSLMFVLAAVSMLSTGCERHDHPTSASKSPAAASRAEHDDHDHTTDAGRHHDMNDEHGGDEHGLDDHDHNHHENGEVDHGEHAESAHSHAEHDHGDHSHDGDGHAHGGEPLELGTREIGGCRVKVVQLGAATDDAAELVFEVVLEGAPSPDALRALVRNRDGAESLKVKATKIGDHTFDVHVGELPINLSRGGTLVVEIENAAETKSGEFEIRG